MERTSTSRKQLYIGMVLFGIIALLLFVKMATSKELVPDGVSYVDEQKTIVGGFSNQEQLVIPEGVLRVDGDKAYDVIYDQVRRLSIPETMEDLGQPEAFEKSFPNVEEIILGSEGSSKGYVYEQGIFYQKMNGEPTYAAIVIKGLVQGDITMPETVQLMRSDLFVGCDAMTSLSIGSAFRHVDYGEGTYTYLDGSCFEGCSLLKKFKVVGKNDFYKAKNDALYCRDVDNEENIQSLDWKLHIVPRGYEGEYVVHSSTVTVGTGAFYECDKITSIDISAGVTEIKDYAIAGCDILERVTIPSTVQYIKQSFVDCPKLFTLTFTGELYYSKVSYNGLQGEGTLLEKILVPQGSAESYKEVLNEEEAELVLEGEYMSDTPLIEELKQTELYVSIDKDGSLYFQWKQVPYAEGYYVQMKMNGWWKTVATLNRAHSCYIKSLTVEDVDMEEGDAGEFRVIASGKGDLTSISPTKCTCYINPPKIVAVKNKQAGSIFVSWEKKDHVSGFYVELVHSGSVQKVFLLEDPSQTSLTIEGLEKGEPYEVRVYSHTNNEGERIYSDYNSEVCNVAL